VFLRDNSAQIAGQAVQEGTADSPYASAAGVNSSLYSAKVPGFGSLVRTDGSPVQTFDPPVLDSGSKAAAADPDITLFCPECNPFRAYFKEAA
jgi:hypothetical protein